MLIFQNITELRSNLETQRPNKKIGLFPTMGALHAGHLSLIKRAVSENDLVVVSIFVNPLQFSPTEDLQQYPRQLEEDCKLCEQIGVDIIFAPSVTEIYGKATSTDSTQSLNLNTQVIPPTTMTSVLCGRFRPGHFQGVATVVTKLLNVVQPNTAYFGKKDAQQLAIIRRLVTDLNIPVEIIGCSIVREDSELAYSSRNKYLIPEQKQQALVLSRSLKKAQKAFRSGEDEASELVDIVKQELEAVPEVKLEYVELVHPQTLIPLEKVEQAGALLAIACYLGSTRLIDNVILQQRKPIIAIDGPAGAGKSTVARRVAQNLGLLYLDTGAMYRAVTWLVMQSDISLENEEAIAELISQAKLELIAAESPQSPVGIKINGEDITQAIRTPQVTANVSKIAAQPAVRQELVKQQQRWGEKGGLVAEGRDIGTHVFPDAEVKIFLTASAQERARRRLEDLKNQGELDISLEQLERDIQERDRLDSTRKIAPLTKASDGIEIITDGLTIEEVTNKIVELLTS
ncbi:MAG: bifunctional pantoate--beta-alanine ligase/(d)CMP kinase [Moorea sp. SIO2B7]|nr:bifunctional pantoate--beta-alanine ligase/(d)CMP kinase [Moorena sp. SIO2B7]